MTLDPEDYVNAIRYILNLRKGKGHVDDIDHLGNRRLRTIDELAADELRKGFLKLRRTVQERMSLKDAEDMTPRSLINPKSISAAIEYFFGRGELSQVVDQTNPLAQLTHERRLSALGPGGLNRKRAGLRGPRRAHLALRPDLPDRDPRGDQHRPDQLAGHLRRRRRVRLPRHPLPRDQARPAHREGRLDAADEESEAYLAPADAPTDDARQAQGPQRHRPLPDRLPHHPRRAGPVHGHLAQADGGGLGRADPVPRARRRQPGADGLEHAAPGGAAPGGRAADRRHRPGAGGRDELGHDRPGAAGRHGHLRRLDPGHHRPQPHLQAPQVRRPERADLPEPEADRRGRPEGQEGRHPRRRRLRPTRASWRWAATSWSGSWPGTATTSRTRSSSASGW